MPYETGAATQQSGLAVPQDGIARFVTSLIAESQREWGRVALAHEEALANSLAWGPDDWPVTNQYPYGDPFSLVRGYQKDRAISDIISPFSAEQTSALTTHLSSAWIGQREILYVEPNGDADAARRARIRERLWDKGIRSPYTNWSLLVWQAFRDVVVRSRGFLEVCHLKRVENRRVFQYNPVNVITNAILNGLGKYIGMDNLGTIRISNVQPVTIFDGPIVRCRPFGSVFRDPTEAVLSESSRWVAYKDCMTTAEVLEQAAAMFPSGSIVPFDAEAFKAAYPSGTAAYTPGPKTTVVYQADATALGAPSSAYKPHDIYVFKGLDPEEDPSKPVVYWLCNGHCIGAKYWDGSGSWNNIVELAWDPMSDFATSVSPIMLLRRFQEMDSLLLSDAVDAATWQSHPAGLVNELVVNDISEIENLRPAQYLKKTGDGQAVEPIQLAGNSQLNLQNASIMREMGRQATGAIAAVVGGAPSGVDTATEFQGISTGAIGRINIMQEINSDVALRRLFGLVVADWRDNITTDEELKQIIGDDGTLGDVTLEDLDGDMECVPMAARYQTVRQKELAAIQALIQQSMLDPYLAAKLKKDALYDDLVYAVAGPRGWRWARTASEMAMAGNDPAALEQMAVMNAGMKGGAPIGTPSPAAEASAQPSQVMPPVTPHPMPPGIEGGGGVGG